MTASEASCGPAVSIVIPCRNEARHIEACLRGVLAFVSPPGGFEVVVADGMSEDGTRDVIARVAAEDPRVRLIDNPKRTTPCALNAGIRAARAGIVARIDAHSDYAPDYLCQCLAVMDETGAENVGGPWLARGGGYLQRAIAATFASPFAVGGARAHLAEHEGPVDTVYLGCFRKQFLFDIGLFDEDLVRNQDDELNFRILRAGGSIWQSPRIRSWYSPRSSLTALYRQYFQYGYWKVLVIRKHGSPASVRHLVPGLFVGAMIVLALAAPFVTAARYGLAGLSALYAAGLLVASVHTAARSGWSLLPVLPAAFACYHFGYGLGFLCGLWDFGVRRRQAGRFTQLTRK